MSGFEGLNVQEISGDETLELYDDPDADHIHNPRTRQRYVEAVTGATFKVRMTLSEQFKLFLLGPDDAVRVTINYDGQKRDWYIDFTAQDLCRTWKEGQLVEHNWTHPRNLCDQTQQWKRGETCFGALDTSELRLPLSWYVTH